MLFSKNREMRLFLLVTLFGYSLSQDGYFPIEIKYQGTHPYVTEVCNQLLTSNGTNVRVDTRIRDITHPCYCVIYDDYLQDLEIKISSHSANDSWNDWFRLSSSDWDSLNYSIPHFYIEPHAPAARFVTYKNNMEVSTMLVSDMQFLSANSRDYKRVNIQCSPIKFPYISATLIQNSDDVLGELKVASENWNLYLILIIGVNVPCVLAITIGIIICIIRRRQGNLTEQNPLHHAVPEENRRENDDQHSVEDMPEDYRRENDDQPPVEDMYSTVIDLNSTRLYVQDVDFDNDSTEATDDYLVPVRPVHLYVNSEVKGYKL